jgi:hypothetical protein
MINKVEKEYSITFEEIDSESVDIGNVNSFFKALDKDSRKNLEVKISVFDKELGITNEVHLIGTSTSTETFLLCENYLVIEGVLVVYFDGNIFVFNLPDLKPLWERTDLCYVFGIYEYEKELIIYDELSILRLDLSGNQRWEYVGVDHFVTYEEGIPFEMKADYIALLDSLENKYKIDYEGNIIDDRDAQFFLKQLSNL